jgi:hypothetical protein
MMTMLSSPQAYGFKPPAAKGGDNDNGLFSSTAPAALWTELEDAQKPSQAQQLPAPSHMQESCSVAALPTKQFLQRRQKQTVGCGRKKVGGMKLRDMRELRRKRFMAGTRFNCEKQLTTTIGEKILEGEFIGGKVGLPKRTSIAPVESPFPSVCIAESSSRRSNKNTAHDAIVTARSCRRDQRLRRKLGKPDGVRRSTRSITMCMCRLFTASCKAESSTDGLEY